MEPSTAYAHVGASPKSTSAGSNSPTSPPAAGPNAFSDLGERALDVWNDASQIKLLADLICGDTPPDSAPAFPSPVGIVGHVNLTNDILREAHIRIYANIDRIRMAFGH